MPFKPDLKIKDQNNNIADSVAFTDSNSKDLSNNDQAMHFIALHCKA